ncbi:MAG: hypothetical protein ACTSQO_07720 [Candidatus Helarchaeota archaeon]
MNEKTEIVTNSGDPKMFYKWKLNSLILRMVYPQIVSNFVIKYNNDISKINKALLDIGKNSARRVISEFPIKEFNTKILIRKITWRHWGTKSIVKGNIKDGELKIIVKKCPLCMGLAPLEIEGLHYCVSFAGFLQGAFEVLQKKYKKLIQNKMTFETIESKGSNDLNCVHLCRIEE